MTTTPEQATEPAYIASDKDFAIQGVLQEVGERLVKRRDVWGTEVGYVGIHRWTYEAKVEIERRKRQGSWTLKVPDEPKLRRQANYLASKEWANIGIPRAADDPPKWEHMAFEHQDVNPWGNTPKTEMMSAYRLIQAKWEPSGRQAGIAPDSGDSRPPFSPRRSE